jgi:hypothetical protein
MKRRDFITLLGGAAAWPIPAAAQAPTSPAQGASPSVRLGYIWIRRGRLRRRDLARHPPGLADVGLVEDRTVAFEARYAQGQPERLRGLVVSRGPA